jgi:EAL domain-containing protein (putative c-di-GMP-specific phosphodiesterase class I)
MRREAELRAGVVAIIAAAAFHPVFQPIVDLASGETVGYEALTRFDSGQRPDLCFADAWSVGLGPDLEIATLEAAVAAGKRLPPGLWLDLNASPRLLADRDRLSAVLSLAQRPIVLEVTEHEVIEDYDAVRQAISSLGPDLRLAVDDAGVGVANFGHIIELRPDFVKLDISLVRRVNANLGRQALVVAMRHFSRTAGCRLIAEGVETDAEAATLRSLGVEYGQGFLFGHPERVEIWVADEPAQRPLA